MKKLISRMLSVVALSVTVMAQAEGPAPAAPIVKGGTMSVSEAQTKPAGVRATFDSWLKDLKRRVARTRARQNQLVTVAAVRGAEATDAPPLYWKGKKSSGPVDSAELDKFENAIEATIAGKPEAKDMLRSFVSSYPKSPLVADANTALKKLDASATAP